MNKSERPVEKNHQANTADRPLRVVYASIFIKAIHQVGAAVFLASFFGIAMPAILLKVRRGRLNEPRNMAIYLARKRRRNTLGQIAGMLRPLQNIYFCSRSRKAKNGTG